MTDPIVVRGHRKSDLRKRFREIQRERGAGTIVAFTNGRATHVQACLTGLLETGSVTEPVYSDEGFAVVRITKDPDVGPEQWTMSNPAPGEIYQENVAGEAIVDTSHPTPPPTSGPGSGADAWRAYAAEATRSPYESWAALNRAEVIELLHSEGVLAERE